MDTETHPFGNRDAITRLFTLAEHQAKSDRTEIVNHCAATRFTLTEVADHGAAFLAGRGMYFFSDATSWWYGFPDNANLGSPAARVAASIHGDGLIVSDLRTYAHVIDTPQPFAMAADKASLEQTRHDHEGWFTLYEKERTLLDQVRGQLADGEIVTFAHRGTAEGADIKRVKNCLLVCTNRRLRAISDEGRLVWQLEWQKIASATQAKSGFSAIILKTTALDGAEFSVKAGFTQNPMLVAWQPVLDEWKLRVELQAFTGVIPSSPG